MVGLPWLRRHNPNIQWMDSSVLFDSDFCISRCCSGSPKSIKTSTNYVSVSTIATPSPSNSPSPLPSQQPSELSSSDQLPDSSRVSIDELKPLPFFQKCRGQEVFVCWIHPDGVSFSARSHQTTINSVLTTKEHVPSSIPLSPEGIPLKYIDLAAAFKTSALDPTTGLPPHREYDLSIELDESKPLPAPGKIYPLSPAETQSLEEYINEALALGRIRPSRSPLGAPCFFVKKPNGGLRLCIDYRGLNAITQKNAYPLPLISDIFDRLGKARRFSRLDLPEAYHLLRIKKGDEWKTAFRCKFGSFEYNVMPFGLTNAPSAFQFFMNDIFADLQHKFLVIYLDDLLIFSEDPTEHDHHVRLVLERLIKHNLVVRPEKCSFDLTEIDFLGHIISVEGVRMDPAKVDAVANWPEPKTKRALQSFLGFANFYRRFVQAFANMSYALTRLLLKDAKFDWNDSCSEAFALLKTAFTTAPVLGHYDFSRSCVIETDASDFAISAVLSQPDAKGDLRPIAFYSRQLLPAEVNYDIGDKELLAIIEALRHWRHYAISVPVDQPVKIFTDHKKLERFLSLSELSRRQFRWSQILSMFNFEITFRPGRLCGNADALSRREDYELTPDTPHVQQMNRPLLVHSPNGYRLDPTISVDAVVVSVQSDLLGRIREASADFIPTITDDPEYEVVDGLAYMDGLVVVPSLDLRIEILEQCHDSPLAGHYGNAKTIELVTRNYWWPGLRRMVRKYISGCDVCKRAKASRHKPYGLLQPLPIPMAPWQDISMDFLTDLPPSDGFDSVFVVKDRFTKMAHFIPCSKAIDAEATAKLFKSEVFRLHGLPKSIVSDRGPQFVSHFWRRLYECLGVKINLSSAHHPETDGSTEVVNQVIEQYLRIYCSYHQDDWISLLPLAEFTYNNSVTAQSQTSPFFANYGYHPTFDIASIRPSSPSQVPRAEERADQFRSQNEELRAQLALSQADYVRFANADRQPAPPFKPGDLVFLDRRHLKSARPSSKLDDKKLGPFKILRQINPVAFELKLPQSMRCHPVFHVSLLHPRLTDPLQRPAQPPPPIEIEETVEFEVNAILDSKRRGRGIVYLVDWKGFGPSERTWLPLTNLSNCLDLVHAFHRRFPQKPRSPLLTKCDEETHKSVL